MKLDEFIEKVKPQETKMRPIGDVIIASLFFDDGIEWSIIYANENEPVDLVVIKDDEYYVNHIGLVKLEDILTMNKKGELLTPLLY